MPRSILVVVNALEHGWFQVDAAFAALRASTSFAETPVNVHLCDETTPAAWAELLARVRPEVLVVGWAVPSFPAGYLDAPDCPVRYLCYFTGSIRRLATRAFLERGGVATNWGDAAAPGVAEHALLLTLAGLRRLPVWRPFVVGEAPRSGKPMPVATRSLHGATVSIHGFGRIARELIRLMEPFRVRVRAYSEGVPADFMRAHGAEPVATLDELFAGAAILVEVEALNDHTLGQVGARQIDLLPPDAVFVNVGRGAVVDEAALARRAARGDLQLALDVLAAEPMPADSPLRDVTDAIISPHIGGPTVDQLPVLGRAASENIRRYLAGEPLLHAMTPELYDRST
ncbi:MAG: hypothetical protein H7Y06_09775 [Opitutaceae bacterium]|nr:hypothetical protein [Opitutaceae bacterium]